MTQERFGPDRPSAAHGVPSRRGARPGGRWGALLGAALVAAAIACGGDGEGEAARAEDPGPAQRASGSGGEIPVEAREAAVEIFATRCATCHGREGEGDGPGSGGLDPQPRNFKDPAWQESVSDEHIANIIQYGGAAVGRSPTMPGNPDLTSRPQVVAALVEHVRSLQEETAGGAG